MLCFHKHFGHLFYDLSSSRLEDLDSRKEQTEQRKAPVFLQKERKLNLHHEHRDTTRGASVILFIMACQDLSSSCSEQVTLL